MCSLSGRFAIEYTSPPYSQQSPLSRVRSNVGFGHLPAQGPQALAVITNPGQPWNRKVPARTSITKNITQHSHSNDLTSECCLFHRHCTLARTACFFCFANRTCSRRCLLSFNDVVEIKPHFPVTILFPYPSSILPRIGF